MGLNSYQHFIQFFHFGDSGSRTKGRQAISLSTCSIFSQILPLVCPTSAFNHWPGPLAFWLGVLPPQQMKKQILRYEMSNRRVKCVHIYADSKLFDQYSARQKLLLFQCLILNEMNLCECALKWSYSYIIVLIIYARSRYS